MTRVSVVVPCFNAAPFVGAAITSALEQDHPDVEVIVIDDESTDGSWDIIRSFGDRIRCERQAHAEAPRARNRGLEIATGAAVMFLDADDVIAPPTLSRLASVLETAGESTLAACRWRRLVRVQSEWVPVDNDMPTRPPGGDPLRAWLSGWYVPPCALMWPVALVKRLGGWDESLTLNQDGDIAVRALLSGATMAFADAGEAFYRRHTDGRTAVSARTGERDMRSAMRTLDKVVDTLREQGRLSEYAEPLAQRYHKVARRAFECGHRTVTRECIARGEALAGRRAITGSLSHRVACRLFGLERKEELAAALASLGFGRARRRNVRRR